MPVSIIPLLSLVLGVWLFSFGLNEINLMRNGMIQVETIDDLYRLKWGFPYFKRTTNFPYIIPYTTFIPLQNAFDLCCFLEGIGFILTIISVWSLS